MSDTIERTETSRGCLIVCITSPPLRLFENIQLLESFDSGGGRKSCYAHEYISVFAVRQQQRRNVFDAKRFFLSLWVNWSEKCSLLVVLVWLCNRFIQKGVDLYAIERPCNRLNQNSMLHRSVGSKQTRETSNSVLQEYFNGGVNDSSICAHV